MVVSSVLMVLESLTSRVNSYESMTGADRSTDGWAGRPSPTYAPSLHLKSNLNWEKFKMAFREVL